jgi:hypothetical protein
MRLSFAVVCMLGVCIARADFYYDFETADTRPVWLGTTQMVENTSASYQGTNAIAFTGTDPYACLLTKLPQGTTNVEFYFYDDYGPNPPLNRYMFFQLLEATNSASFAGFSMLDGGWGTTPPTTMNHYYAWATCQEYSARTMGPVRTIGWHQFKFAIGPESVAMSVDGALVFQTNIIRTPQYLQLSWGIAGPWGRMDYLSGSTGTWPPPFTNGLVAYDAVSEFNTNTNPCGVWSYGWSTSLAGQFQFLTNNVSLTSWTTGWWNGKHEPDSCTIVGTSGTNSDPYMSVRFTPDVLGLDPESHAVVLRFTAPTNSYYQVVGLFRLLDLSAGGPHLHILKNNQDVLFSQDTAGGLFGSEYPFQFASTYLGENETLEFVVSVGARYQNQFAGLKVTVAALSPPVITTEPQDNTVLAGSNVVLSVSVVGNQPMTYQWTCSGTNIVGANTETLILTNVQFEQSGNYSVAITNSMGYAISRSAALTVLSAPLILSQPASQVGYWGYGILFQVDAEGSLPLSYQWYIDGFPISWATNAILDFSDLELTDAGEFWVEVTNLYGSITSDSATLIVNPVGVSIGLHPFLTLNGKVGKTFGIQYTTNLSQTNSWIPLTTLTLTQPSMEWTDTNANAAPGNPSRFYRVIAVP